MAAVRDATIDEMGDVAQAMMSLDQSYTIQAPLVIGVHNFGFGGGFGGFGGSGFGGFGGIGLGGTSAASSSMFVDAATYSDCGRGNTKVNEFPGSHRPGQVDPVEAEPIAQ
jgi:hypothetical protein